MNTHRHVFLLLTAAALALATTGCSDDECESLADCPDDAVACSNGNCQWCEDGGCADDTSAGDTTVTDTDDDHDDPDLGGCLTNPSCCPNPDSPFCGFDAGMCRGETDCYMECGRCLVRGCEPPDAICEDSDADGPDAADGGDATAPKDAVSDARDGATDGEDLDTTDTQDAVGDGLDTTDAADADGLDCAADETRLADACRQCGPAGGCADSGPTCRATCPDGTCDQEGLSCASDGICKRVCL